MFISPQICTESGENVADGALVPPAGLSCISCAPDSSFISPGRRSPQKSTLSQAMAVPEPEELTGRAGKHRSTGNGVGEELLPHRWSEIGFWRVFDKYELHSCFHIQSSAQLRERKSVKWVCGCNLQTCRGMHGVVHRSGVDFGPLRPNEQVKKYSTWPQHTVTSQACCLIRRVDEKWIRAFSMKTA